MASTLASIGVPESLAKSSATVEINRGWKVKALFDSGSSESYIHPSLVKAAELLVHPFSSTVSMATSALSTKVEGSVRSTSTTRDTYTKTFVCPFYQNFAPTSSWDLISSHNMAVLHSVMEAQNHLCLSVADPLSR